MSLLHKTKKCNPGKTPTGKNGRCVFSKEHNKTKKMKRILTMKSNSIQPNKMQANQAKAMLAQIKSAKRNINKIKKDTHFPRTTDEQFQYKLKLQRELIYNKKEVDPIILNHILESYHKTANFTKYDLIHLEILLLQLDDCKEAIQNVSVKHNYEDRDLELISRCKYLLD